jgi:hypothetical protein
MIKIKKSKTADTRTCDVSKVSKETLLESSAQHIRDVSQGMGFFIDMMEDAITTHDYDKFNDIDGFYRDFKNGFKTTDWWDNHRKINRHHLLVPDGVPEDVNLIDVMEMIVDCVMAGMGRTGYVYNLDIEPDVLMKAFNNTVEKLRKEVVVET